MSRSVHRPRWLVAGSLVAGLVSTSPSLVTGQPPATPTTPVEVPEKRKASPLKTNDVRVRAESYEHAGQGHIEARGLVDLQFGSIRVQADKADLFEEPRADGSVGRRILAEGNVVFIRGAERLSGDRLELDGNGRGVLLNAVGYVEPGVFVQARRLERVDDRTYRLEGGQFTPCAQPNPRWRFTASRATVEVDHRITARNAVFELKGVPVFYTPYVLYPIRKDGRATGFLLPRFGHSPSRGYELGAGFFWAMGRSADQTFHFDNYSRLGRGYGHDLRWAGHSPSRGSLRSYLFEGRAVPAAAVVPPADPSTPAPAVSPDSLDYDLDWSVLQALPGRTRATLTVRSFSSLLFEQRFQPDLVRAATTTERRSAILERDLGFARLSSYLELTRASRGTAVGTKLDRGWDESGRLPGVSLTRFPQRFGPGGLVLGFSATADHILDRGERPSDGPVESEVESQAASRDESWSRYDLRPTLSRPFRLSFLEVNPSVSYRYTRYGATRVVDASMKPSLTETPSERSYFEGSLELRGPTFARVFATPGFAYSERFKHTIGPELTWSYRSRSDGLNALPQPLFDTGESLAGSEQVSYGLVQRLYAKRRGPSGILQAYELFSWRLTQTYYRIAEGLGPKDLNFSSPIAGPTDLPEHVSPISSRMRLHPTPDLSLDYDLEYDVNFEQLLSTSASARVSRPRLLLEATWWRAFAADVDPAKRLRTRDDVQAGLSVELVPSTLFLEGSAVYGLLRDTTLPKPPESMVLHQARARLRYAAQCCGFVVQYTRSRDLEGRVDPRWGAWIELAHLGAVGGFFPDGLLGGRPPVVAAPAR